MKNYVLRNGTEITVSEMAEIVMYYEVNSTKDRLMEEYDIEDEDVAKEIAEKVRDIIDDYHLSEDEAIDEIINDYI